jgi:hypothetical protein
MSHRGVVIRLLGEAVESSQIRTDKSAPSAQHPSEVKGKRARIDSAERSLPCPIAPCLTSLTPHVDRLVISMPSGVRPKVCPLDSKGVYAAMRRDTAEWPLPRSQLKEGRGWIYTHASLMLSPSDESVLTFVCSAHPRL